MKWQNGGGYEDRICLHLSITYGSPLSEKIKDLDTFYQPYNGFFVIRRNQGKKLMFLPQNVKIIREEFEAQIQKYLSYGFKLNHIDSHHYVHLNVASMLALLPLIKKYNIKSVRSYNREVSRFGIKRPIYQTVYFKLHNLFCGLLFKDMVKYALPAEVSDKHREIKRQKRVEVYVHPYSKQTDNVIECYDYSTVNEGNDYTLDEISQKLSVTFDGYEREFYNNN